MCERCAELESEVRELRAALADASIYPVMDVERVAARLSVTPDQSRILLVLYETGAVMNTGQIDALLPVQGMSYRARKDPDFRAPKTISVQIWHVRQRLGHDVFTTHHGVGVSLSNRGRALVEKALGRGA